MRYLKRFLESIKRLEYYAFLKFSNTVWKYTNIYHTAQIGYCNTIGSYTEIGDKVKIGNYNRIGAKCFIPHGVIIGHHCFKGPCVTFTNDRYPPSGEDRWERTVIENEASIGAGSVIIPGITIGKQALIGAGSVVTHSVPRGEKWAGNPARRIGMRSRSI